MTGLIIDNFAGGGGASTGIEAALGRAVDIAINHDEQAIRMHEVNHPGTLHIRNNIWQVDPLDATKGHHVDLAWFSPDCKHFSKAKGGKPREKSIRDLAWVVVHWVKRLQDAAKRAGDPEWRQVIKVIGIENVEEFQTWGPLCDQGQPIKARAGETFRQWCAELRKRGGRIEFKELRACDYGAPTIRKRFFMVVRFDGQPIVWPAPTHGKPGTPDVLSGKLKPWRTAAEIIDWSIPCPSIFERNKPLAEKTLRRIAHGIMKFVVNNPRPFIVPLTHHGSADRSYGLDQPLPTVTGANRGEMAVINPTIAPFVTYAQQGGANRSVEDPHHTICANSKDQNCIAQAVLSPVIVGCGGRRGQSGPVGPEQPFPTTTTKADACLVTAFMAKYASGNAPSGMDEPVQTVEANAKDQNCVAAAHLVHIGNGEREGQAPRVKDVETPLGTVVASNKHFVAVAQLLAAHIEQANGGPNNDHLAGGPADAPLSTATSRGSQQRVVTSNLIKLRGTSDAHLGASAQGVDEPLGTISAGGTHAAEVRAFLIKYYGNEQDGHGLDQPIGTVTVQDRFGLVTVTIGGEEYVIVDIGMRMLTPRELFNAQGFPPDYIIDRDAQGQPITKTAQVAKCGNSVCPPLAKALAGANAPRVEQEARAA